MISGQESRGFTIIETLIVIAVSGALIVSAFGLIAGSQNKTEFTQAINAFNQQLTDISNNVESGYYAKSGKLTCTVDVLTHTVVIDTSIDKPLGSNTQCVYAGRAVQLSVDGQGDDMTVWNIAVPAKGRDLDENDKLESPFLFGPERIKLQYGLSVKSVKTEASTDIGAYALFTFPPTPATGSPIAHTLNSGANRLNAATINGSALNQTETELQAIINTHSLLAPPAPGTSYGIASFVTFSKAIICVDSGTTKQSAIITVGGTERAGLTDMEIKTGSCP